MVSETWYSEIESTIFTYLQYQLKTRLDAPFPKLNLTTANQKNVDEVDKFPTVYVHMLPCVETGRELLNETVPAVRATFEIQVYSDKSESECRKIITSCIQEMKKLHFNVTILPDPQTSDKKYYAISRFTRIIGNGDSDIVPQ